MAGASGSSSQVVAVVAVGRSVTDVMMPRRWPGAASAGSGLVQSYEVLAISNPSDV